MRCLSIRFALQKTVQVDTRFYQDTDDMFLLATFSHFLRLIKYSKSVTLSFPNNCCQECTNL